MVREACVYPKPKWKATINKKTVYLSDCIQEIIMPSFIISNHELVALLYMKYNSFPKRLGCCI